MNDQVKSDPESVLAAVRGKLERAVYNATRDLEKARARQTGILGATHRLDFETALLAGVVEIFDRVAGSCDWHTDDVDGWAAECGLEWIFIDDGGPIDNGMTYCPQCGRRIQDKGPVL